MDACTHTHRHTSVPIDRSRPAPPLPRHSSSSSSSRRPAASASTAHTRQQAASMDSGSGIRPRRARTAVLLLGAALVAGRCVGGLFWLLGLAVGLGSVPWIVDLSVQEGSWQVSCFLVDDHGGGGGGGLDSTHIHTFIHTYTRNPQRPRLPSPRGAAPIRAGKTTMQQQQPAGLDHHAGRHALDRQEAGTFLARPHCLHAGMQSIERCPPLIAGAGRRERK